MRLLPKDKDLGWTPWAWLIYIVPFAITPAAEHWRASLWIATFAATIAFVPLYLRSYWARDRECILIAAAITLLGVLFWPWSPGAGAFFIYAAGVIGQYERTEIAVRGISVIALIVMVEIWLGHVTLWNATWPLVFTILVGAINIHFSQVGRANTRLHLAQEEIEHLAKLAERERIARDLHDLLGHTLSVIILKSELASKLAERDVERAKNEIRDVERISRDALAQVRTAVRGYRSGGLSAEIDEARRALDAAGVALEANVDATQLPPSHEAVLSMAMREAITNIVRHANAQHCTIRVATTANECMLTVSDDGRGGSDPFGSGLTGMRERVETLGGTLRRDGAGGTTLTITLPLVGQTLMSVRESA